jgi:Tfp pilus assembly protein PilZ
MAFSWHFPGTTNSNYGVTLMQKAWLVTMFIFSVAFFLIFFAVYFFRPRKKDKITPQTFERELLDPEEIPIPHRAEPNWPATIETAAGETAQANIVSVTQGSAFITSTTKLAIGEKFQITVHLPDRSPLQLRAEVTWSNMHLPAENVVNRGMGIRFIETGEDAVCLINDTINQRAAAPDKAAPAAAE